MLKSDKSQLNTKFMGSKQMTENCYDVINGVAPNASVDGMNGWAPNTFQGVWRCPRNWIVDCW